MATVVMVREVSEVVLRRLGMQAAARGVSRASHIRDVLARAAGEAIDAPVPTREPIEESA